MELIRKFIKGSKSSAKKQNLGSEIIEIDYTTEVINRLLPKDCNPHIHPKLTFRVIPDLPNEITELLLLNFRIDKLLSLELVSKSFRQFIHHSAKIWTSLCLRDFPFLGKTLDSLFHRPIHFKILYKELATSNQKLHQLYTQHNSAASKAGCRSVRAIVTGAKTVGKTAFVMRSLRNEFQTNLKPTLEQTVRQSYSVFHLVGQYQYYCGTQVEIFMMRFQPFGEDLTCLYYYLLSIPHLLSNF
jgi:hypothetical protein